MPLIRVSLPEGIANEKKTQIRKRIKNAVLKTLAPKEIKYDYVSIISAHGEIGDGLPVVDIDLRPGREIERKKKLVENLTKNGKKADVKIVRIPYYFQLTKDVAKFLFNDLIKHYSKDLKNLSSNGYYSEEKFYSAISKSYFNLFTGKGASSDNEVLSCGLHRSKEVPSTFCESGIEKLLKDFKFFRSINEDEKISVPKSVEHQYMWSLKYFLDDVQTYDNKKDNEKLILPTWHQEFMDRYEENINNKKEDQLNFIRIIEEFTYSSLIPSFMLIFEVIVILTTTLYVFFLDPLSTSIIIILFLLQMV